MPPKSPEPAWLGVAVSTKAVGFCHVAVPMWLIRTWTNSLGLICVNHDRVFFVAVAVSLLLAGCGGSQFESKLTGTWGIRTNGASITTTFAKDRTFIQTINGSVKRTMSGHWTIEGRRLIIELDGKAYETNKIAKVNDTVLVIRHEFEGPQGKQESEMTLPRIK